MEYVDFLNQLTDTRHLSTPPALGERAATFPASTVLALSYLLEENRYVDWDANDDGGGYIRELSGGSVVAAELEGPGMIWRSWSAMPDAGMCACTSMGTLHRHTLLALLHWLWRRLRVGQHRDDHIFTNRMRAMKSNCHFEFKGVWYFFSQA